MIPMFFVAKLSFYQVWATNGVSFVSPKYVHHCGAIWSIIVYLTVLKRSQDILGFKMINIPIQTV